MNKHFRNLIIAIIFSFGLLFVSPRFSVFAGEEETQHNSNDTEVSSDNELSDNYLDEPFISENDSIIEELRSVEGFYAGNEENIETGLIDEVEGGNEVDQPSSNIQVTPETTETETDISKELNNENIKTENNNRFEEELNDVTVDQNSEESVILQESNSLGEDSEAEFESEEETFDSANALSLCKNVQIVSIDEPLRDEQDVECIEGVAYIRGASSGYKDIPVYYHYSDSYFEDCEEVQEDGSTLENAYIYNESLSSISSVMSSASEMSIFSLDGDEDTKYLYMSRNIEDIMRQLGFENITINNAYKSEIAIETIMLVAGKKTVSYGGNDYTLIALFPDSGTSDAEWPLNVELGEGDYHEGFEYGASAVLLPFLKDYIESNEINGNVKLWISGMSRAAGFANVACGLVDLAIDDNTLGELLTNSISLEKKNIYLYTFGCPATVSKNITWNMDSDGNYVDRKTEFNHMHNYLNGFDIIIHAVADEWDMDRFGQAHINSKFTSDLAKDEEEFDERVQEFCKQYVYMSGTALADLNYNRDYMYYDAETESFHFCGADFRTAITNDDLETFSRRFMKEIAPLIPRDKYTKYIQPAMELFFGTSYFQMTEIKNAVLEEADRYTAEIEQTVQELFWEGLSHLDFSQLFEYIKNDVNPSHSIPQILINAFKATNTSYNYDFSNHQYDENLAIDENMQSVIWRAMKQAGFGIIDILSRIRLRDIMTAIDIDQAIKAGYDILDSGHNLTLNVAWARAYDDQTRQISDIYDIDMTAEDAWGYRMLNLPLNTDYCVYVVDEDTGELIYSFDMVNGISQNAKHFNNNWFVHLGTGNKGIGKVLYLQAGHNYIVGFTPISENSLVSFSVDEWSSHYYRDTFRPVNHIDSDTEDGTKFLDLAISTDGVRKDSILLHLGALKSYPKMGESNIAGKSDIRLMTASVTDPAKALADYTVEKIIEMLALDGTDGYTIAFEKIKLSSSGTAQFIVEAMEKAGYIFDGWFLGDSLLTNNHTYTAEMAFNDIGKTIVARYHMIPEPNSKTQDKADPATVSLQNQREDFRAEVVSTSISNINNDGITRVSANTVSKKMIVPNTSDQFSEWIVLMICCILIACGAITLLKHTA